MPPAHTEDVLEHEWLTVVALSEASKWCLKLDELGYYAAAWRAASQGLELQNWRNVTPPNIRRYPPAADVRRSSYIPRAVTILRTARHQRRAGAIATGALPNHRGADRLVTYRVGRARYIRF